MVRKMLGHYYVNEMRGSKLYFNIVPTDTLIIRKYITSVRYNCHKLFSFTLIKSVGCKINVAPINRLELLWHD